LEKLKSILKTYKDQLFALLILLVLTALFVPSNFKNKVPVQSDIVQFKGAASEITEYRKKEGGTILWTNSLFAGMPAYTISNPNEPVIIKHLKTPATPRIWSQLFLYVFCAFIMLKAFKVRTWLALIGAIGIGLATENLTILAVGHNTKAAAIGYLPLVIAGCQYLFRKKHLLGLTVLAAGFALQIYVNHVQITYYGGFMVVLFFLFMLVQHIKEKRLKDYLIAAALALGGAGIALGANSLNLLLLQEYAQESIRGESALTMTKGENGKTNVQNGLTMDYVFSYSMGWSDYMATIIPNYSGGDSDKLGLYYGDIGSTSGPKYIGASIFILACIGLVLVPGMKKWWLISTILLTIILSMGGNHFTGINEWMYNHFPMYNKFRAPSMMIVLIQLSVGLLAILGLENFLANRDRVNFKHLAIAGGSGLALLLLLTISGTAFNDFNSTPKQTSNGLYDADAQFAMRQIQQQGGQADPQNINRFKEQLSDMRITEMKKDGYRSLFFAITVLTFIFLIYKEKIHVKYALLAIGLLVTADMWFIGKRYLDHNDFKRKQATSQPFRPYAADLAIQKDKSYYRVLDLTESTLNSNRCAYFHKSIGGYSAAKIRRFQDLWDWYLTEDLDKGNVQNNAILNMLNMKYFIYPNQQQKGGAPQYAINRNALGNAWFLRDISFVKNADSALVALGTLDTRYTGIVESKLKELVGKSNTTDSAAKVTFDRYHPEKLEYTSTSTQAGNLAFSEVFYDKGWKSYIDNKEVPHYRVNYVLRGLAVPAGTHKITFKFEPEKYALGSALALGFGSIIYLLIGLSIFVWIKKELRGNNTAK
tara:strand:- start:9317 stop:11776 length:2460 start_codon:yes stop_codon:yes gene_type:complete